MSQITRKWIENGAINASKIDATSTDQTYVMHGLQITADTSVGGAFSVGGISSLSDATISGDASILQNLTVGGPTHILYPGTLTVDSKTYMLSDATVTGNLQVTGQLDAAYLSIPNLYVPGDGTFGVDLSVIGRTTTGFLAAPQIIGDSTVSGGFEVKNLLTTAKIAITGDTTIGGGLDVIGILTAPQINGDTTVAGKFQVIGDSTIGGGIRAMGRVTSNDISTTGDATIGGGLQVTNSLTAPSINGDTTVTGGLKINNSLTAPQILGDTTISGSERVNSMLTVTGSTILGNTGTPGATLDIRSVSGYPLLLGSYPPSSTYNVLSLNGNILVDGNSVGLLGGAGNSNLYIQSGNLGDIHIRTGNGSAYSEKMTILNGGNVGILNSGPSYTLDVNGSIHSAIDTTAGGGVRAMGRVTSNDISTNGISTGTLSGTGDSTILGGLEVGSRLTASSHYCTGALYADTIRNLYPFGSGVITLYGDTTIATAVAGSGGLNVRNSLTVGSNGTGKLYAPRISGDTTISGGNVILEGSNLIQVGTGGGGVAVSGASFFISPDATFGGNIEIYGQVLSNIILSGTVDIYTTAFVQLSPANIQGFASFVFDLVYYKQVGKLVHVWFDIVGESSADIFHITGLPMSNNSSPSFGTAFVITDGGYTYSSPGYCVIGPSDTEIDINIDANTGDVWQTTGTKIAMGYICYQAA